MKNRLFMICPDAHLENIIPSHFSGESYFLTSLGAAFEPMSSEYADTINRSLELNDVKEICIVVDAYSRFLRNIIVGGHNYGTKAEMILQELYKSNIDQISQIKGSWGKCLELAKIHLSKQLDQLQETAYIGEKIAQGQLKVTGVIYLRKDQQMQGVDYRCGADIIVSNN